MEPREAKTRHVAVAAVVAAMTVLAVIAVIFCEDHSLMGTRWEEWTWEMRKEPLLVALHRHDDPETREKVARAALDLIVECAFERQPVRLIIGGRLAALLVGGPLARRDEDLIEALDAYVEEGRPRFDMGDPLMHPPTDWYRRPAAQVYLIGRGSGFGLAGLRREIAGHGWEGAIDLREPVVAGFGGLSWLMRLRLEMHSRRAGGFPTAEALLAMMLLLAGLPAGSRLARLLAMLPERRPKGEPPPRPRTKEYEALGEEERKRARRWWALLALAAGAFLAMAGWVEARPWTAWVMPAFGMAGLACGWGVARAGIARARRRLEDALILRKDLRGGDKAVMREMASDPQARASLLGRSTSIQRRHIRNAARLQDPETAFRAELWVARNCLHGVSDKLAIEALKLSVEAEYLLLGHAREAHNGK